MKRVVAFLDILGFKQKIEMFSLEQISSIYEQMIDEVNSLNSKVLDTNSFMSGTKRYCKHFIFSDSIILIANDDSDDSFKDLILFTWKFMQLSIIKQMPLRGAISYGDIYINEIKNIVVGKALTDAYLLENQQDWIGVILDHGVEQRYNDFLNSDEIYDVLLFVYSVPFKDGSTKQFRALNWRINLISSLGIRQLFQNPTSDKRVQKKIENTLMFSKYLVKRRFLYSDVEPFHNKFWYGLPPPFKPLDDGY